jgi:AcrR family transcriptional regulator
VAGYLDPRAARTRKRLIDAATALLRAGGPDAVTVDAVRSQARAGRATLYRHFCSGEEMLAAAFAALIPDAPHPPQSRSLQDWLTKALICQADSMATSPILLTAIAWLAGGKCQRSFDTSANSPADGSQLNLLYERLSEHTAALRAVLGSPQAAQELQPFDQAEALTMLLGPVVLGMLTHSGYFDYHACARHAVQGFIAANRVRLPAERRRMS